MNIALTDRREKKHLAAFWLSIMLVWVLLNASWSWQVLLVGSIVATLLVLIFPTHGFLFAGTKFTPKTRGWFSSIWGCSPASWLSRIWM